MSDSWIVCLSLELSVYHLNCLITWIVCLSLELSVYHLNCLFITWIVCLSLELSVYHLNCLFITVCVTYVSQGKQTTTIILGLWCVPIQIILLYLKRRSAVGWGTALQVGRSRVRLPMVSLEFFNWHIQSGRAVALGSTQPLTKMRTRNISWGVKAAGA